MILKINCLNKPQQTCLPLQSPVRSQSKTYAISSFLYLSTGSTKTYFRQEFLQFSRAGIKQQYTCRVSLDYFVVIRIFSSNTL